MPIQRYKPEQIVTMLRQIVTLVPLSPRCWRSYNVCSIRTARKRDQPTWRARWYGLRPDVAEMQTFSSPPECGRFFYWFLMRVSQ